MVTTPPGMRCPSVLIVDDDPSNRRVAERVLGGAGYAVTAADAGPSALHVLSEHGPFDVYVLDYLMPGMNGAELAQRIRAAHADARVLYYSSFSPRLFRDTNVLRSDEAFLQKPAPVRALRDAVSFLLSGSGQALRG
jgi:CheY-like chemotaxis protein